MKHLFKASLTFLIVFTFMIVAFRITSNAASTKSITSLRIETGEKAINKLKDGGFNPCYQNLNCSNSRTNKVYLGYKKSNGTPITNIIISDKNSSQLQYNNINYTLLSSNPINVGGSSYSAYLYYTTDTKAGDAIKSITFNVYNPNAQAKNKSEGFALLNDGSEPVRSTVDKGSYNFANDNNEFIYMMMVKNNIYKPYVKDLHMVVGENKRKCISALSSLGCNYYCVDDFGTNKANAIMMIGFTKTKNKDEALRNIITINDPKSMKEISEIKCNNITYKALEKSVWEDYNKAIYVTYDSGAGKPIRDICSLDYNESKTTIKEYASKSITKNNRSLAATATLFDNDYLSEIENKTGLEYNASPFFNGKKLVDGNIVILSSGKTEGSPWNIKDEEFQTYLTKLRGNAETTEKEDEVNGEDRFEEIDNSNKEEDEKLEADEEDNSEEEEVLDESEETQPENDDTGAIVGNSKFVFIISSIVIILGVGAYLIYSKKKKENK